MLECVDVLPLPHYYEALNERVSRMTHIEYFEIPAPLRSNVRRKVIRTAVIGFAIEFRT